MDFSQPIKNNQWWRDNFARQGVKVWALNHGAGILDTWHNPHLYSSFVHLNGMFGIRERILN